jgi:acetyltransferase
MILRPNAIELILGLAEDGTFGPIVLFGAGGTAVEVMNDKALALPPLDMNLAVSMMARTRVYRLLQGYRDRPAADLDAIGLALIGLSQLAADFPEVRELDINPLLADEHGVIALDARAVVERQDEAAPDDGNRRFAIRPYPTALEATATLADGRVVRIRPVRPEDERFYDRFFAGLTPRDVRLRLFSPVKALSHAFIARLTQIDYARAMAFMAFDESGSELLGVSRLSGDPDYTRAEYAIIVRSDMKGQGLGWLLMQKLIDHARSEGLERLHGEVLSENTTMLRMCRELGFTVTTDSADPGICQVSLDL